MPELSPSSLFLCRPLALNFDLVGASQSQSRNPGLPVPMLWAVFLLAGSMQPGSPGLKPCSCSADLPPWSWQGGEQTCCPVSRLWRALSSPLHSSFVPASLFGVGGAALCLPLASTSSWPHCLFPTSVLSCVLVSVQHGLNLCPFLAPGPQGFCPESQRGHWAVLALSQQHDQSF